MLGPLWDATSVVTATLTTGTISSHAGYSLHSLHMPAVALRLSDWVRLVAYQIWATAITNLTFLLRDTPGRRTGKSDCRSSYGLSLIDHRQPLFQPADSLTGRDIKIRRGHGHKCPSAMRKGRSFSSLTLIHMDTRPPHRARVWLLVDVHVTGRYDSRTVHGSATQETRYAHLHDRSHSSRSENKGLRDTHYSPNGCPLYVLCVTEEARRPRRSYW
jgi:hypothetical protein